LGEKLDLQDLLELSPSFGVVIVEFQKICESKREILNNPNYNSHTKNNKLAELKYQGKSIENMNLNFRISEGTFLNNFQMLY
jgi:hypothetical protein